MSVTWLRLVLLLPLFAIVMHPRAAFSGSGRDFPTATIAPPPAVLAALVDLTNVERTRAGRAGLRATARLMRAAQIHADQMARLGRIDHVLPGAAYPRPDDRLAVVEYRWQAFAENVASGQRDASDALESWMKSKGHRANILNSTFTELGTGYARDAAGQPYYVQVFGQPLP